MRWLIRVAGLINTAILARLLVPEDFGLVAMSMVVVGFLTTAFSFGLDLAVIQKKDADAEFINSAWTIRVLQGVVIAVCILAASSFLGDYYNEPRVKVILQTLAVTSVFVGFENIGVVLLRKDLRFKVDFIYNLVTKVVSVVVSIGLALWLRNYWALVFGMIISQLARVSISYMVSDYRPNFSLSRVKEIWGFSQWAFVNSISNFVAIAGPQFLLGGVANARTVGFYSVGFEIGSLAQEEVSAPTNRALMPGFAKLQDDKGRLRSAFLKGLGLLTLMIAPIAFGIGAVSEQFVAIVLGEQWLQIAGFVTFVSCLSVSRALYSYCNQVFLVTGRARAASLLALVNGLLVLLAVLPMFELFGLDGIAWLMGGVSFFVLVVSLIIKSRDLGISFVEIVSHIWRPVFAACVMFMCVRLTTFSSFPLFWDAFFSVTLGASVFVASIGLFWLVAGRPDGAEKEAFDIAMGVLKRLPIIGNVFGERGLHENRKLR